MRLMQAMLVALVLVCAPPAWAQEAAGSGGRNAAEWRDAPYVVLVSFDGFRHDYIDRYEAPNFRRVARGGVRADGLMPIFPSKTFPNHYAIATGLWADRNGLADNSFWAPELKAGYALGDTVSVRDGRFYGGEPIWVTAEKQGMVTASYFFVGTEAAIDGVRPTYWEKYDVRVPNEARVDKALEWLRLPAETRPHLVTLYVSDVDHAGHEHGPESPEVAAAVLKVDSALGRLLDGIAALPIAKKVDVILVSDHGMLAVSPARTEYVSDVMDLGRLKDVHVYGAGPLANLWTGDDVARRDSIASALAAGLEHAKVYRREEIPDRLHYRTGAHVGDILVVAEPGWQVLPRRGRRAAGGNHGWDVDATPEMRGIFLAMGPGIRKGARVPAFRNVNVYPLVAKLLGIAPAGGIDGKLEAVKGVLAQPALR